MKKVSDIVLSILIFLTGSVLAEDILATRKCPEFRTSIKDALSVLATSIFCQTVAAELTQVINKFKVFIPCSMVTDGEDAVVPVEDTLITRHNRIISVYDRPKIVVMPTGSEVSALLTQTFS
uniref:Secreted protein n=1 Tax=Syphacia muris TaxID=451379 RepID=A0A0N5AQA0_9BILA